VGLKDIDAIIRQRQDASSQLIGLLQD